jgi:DNA-binding transcriptional ArsR family regulator
MGDPSSLDPLIHAPVRLAILSALLGVDHLSFTELREIVGATDGNLATHAAKLEEAGYVEVDKQFVGRKPHTTYRLTELGRSQFLTYLDALEALLPRRNA